MPLRLEGDASLGEDPGQDDPQDSLGVVGKTAVDKLAEEEKNNQIDDVPQRTTIDVQSTEELGNDPNASMDETDD